MARKDDNRLLRGRARFVDDVHLDRMAEGVFVRSPHPHAEIVSIDVSAALAAGANLVLTAADLPFIEKDWLVRYWHPSIRGRPPRFLATDRVRFVGEPVAFLVAADRYTAEDLAPLVEVSFRPLPAVIAGAATPLLHEEWPDNVAAGFSARRGDPALAMANAACRTSHTVRFSRQVPLPLETRGAVADFRAGRRRLTVRMSTQAHYNVRENLASLLELPEANVRVVCEDVGGGFGAKSRTYCEEIVVAFASLVLGRPVKWIEDRAENLLATTHSRDITAEMELGHSGDGGMEALKATLSLDAGAYIFTSGIATVELAGALLTGAYRIEHFEIEVVVLGSNKTPTATYRGAGQPEAALALETVIDRAARSIGIGSAEIRERNLVTGADLPWATGTRFGGMALIFDAGDFPEMLQRAVVEGGYTDAVEASGGCERVAWGLACGVDGSGFVNFESARVRIDSAGNVSLHSGMTSQGQGQSTTFAKICAETLGTSLDRIEVSMGDTALLPFGRGAFASRGAIFGGNAVHGAAVRLRQAVLRHAGRLTQSDPDVLSIVEGSILREGEIDTGLTIGDIARAVAPGGPLFDGVPALEAQYVFSTDQPITMGMSVHAAKVGVDTETGRVRLIDYFVVHDVGQALDRAVVDGQIIGGVIEGIGNAVLTEFIYAADGQPMTTTLGDYLVPSAVEAPTIGLAYMETRPTTNPLGVRGIGESGTIAPPAAILNAVARIAGPGADVSVVPLSPPRVLAALADRFD